LLTQQRGAAWLLLLLLFVVSRVFLYATPVEYELNTLIITLKNDTPSASPANYIHHQPDDHPPVVSPEKIMTSLQEKWDASSYSMPFNADVITPYAAITAPNKKTPPTKIIIASFPKHVDITIVKQDYQMRPSVRKVEFNYYVYINQNDPHLLPVHDRQYHIQDLSLRAAIMIDSEMSIPVAVIDTGVDAMHPGLRHAIDTTKGVSFLGYSKTNSSSADITDENGHGTHISGIIAAKPVDNNGVWGINSQATIIPIKFIDATGKGTQVDAAMAIRYAVDHGAKIINCSWGYFKKTSVLEDAIQYALKKGVIIVGSVGNNNTMIPEYPAAFDDVITVGAVTKGNSRASYSSYGSHLDFMSFGSDIYSTLPNNGYGVLSGTSQATAIVSGVISRALSLYPSMTKQGIYALIKTSSTDMAPVGYDQWSGHGVVHVDGILEALGEVPSTTAVIPVSSPSQDNSGGLLSQIQSLSSKTIWIILGIAVAVVFGVTI
jgi:thermitase